ncbi:MAG TPA: ATP-binding protein [Oscillatoriaceae cyanobacterium]
MGNFAADAKTINNRYELQDTLWTGGMGDVFRAFDRQRQREVAIKILDGDHPIAPPRLHRFKQEFRRTPGLVPDGAWEVYDMGLTEHGLLFMTLECPKEGSGGTAPGNECETWRALLAAAEVLDGTAGQAVLDWLMTNAQGDRALLQILDDDGQAIATLSAGEGADQARYALERVRYDRAECALDEPDLSGLGLPLLIDETLYGVLFVGRAQGAVRADLLRTAASDLALVLTKDRGFRKSRADAHHLAMLNELSRMISATMDLPQILRMVLVQALELSEAEQGAVFWGPERLATLDRQGREVDDLRVSQSVVNQVLEEGRSLSILDTQEDARFATQASIMDLQLRSLMCVPLRAGQEIRGVLYVSSQSVNRTFGPRDLELLEGIASQVALALETAQSYQTIRELNAGLEEKVKARTAELQEALHALQKTQAQLVQSEKMASLGQMVAGVAHELNNPLNFIHGNLKVLRDTYLKSIEELLALYDKKLPGDAEIARLKDDLDYEYMAQDLQKIIESALKGTTRSQRIVEDLKLFSGHDEAELKPVDLRASLESTIALIQGRFADKVRISTELAALPEVTVLGKQLNQAFLALLTNACQAIAHEGEVHITLRQEGEQAIVTVRDTGVGIPEENLPKVFDPFFTTRPVGEGTGLGLTTAYSIVERHNGRIELRSTQGEGTTALLSLPMAGVALGS